MPMTGTKISRSVCTLDCPDSCSVLLTRDQEGRYSLRGDGDHPFTAGFTCRKSRFFLERLQHPSRLKVPLLRQEKGWKAISWEDALDLCAKKIQDCRREPLSILHFHGEGAKGVLKQMSKLFFDSLGATRVRGSLCDAAGFVACVMDFGSRENHDIMDLLNAKAIVNWGRDLPKSSVHTSALVSRARKKGARVLTISPGGDGSHAFSDDRVRVRPGVDRFLAAAVIGLLWEKKGVSQDVLERATRHEPFRQLIFRESARDLLRRCHVDEEGARTILRYYTDFNPTATIIGTGLQRYAYGGENVRFINALAFLSGNIGLQGGGVYFHMHSLRNLNLHWARAVRGGPTRTFLMPTIGRDILQASDPPIRMIWVDGSNFINQAPNSSENVRAFESIDFKVVVDAFMTDTAMRADLVLPCALAFEQEDVEASYMHDYVQHVNKVLDPPEGARTDHWILRELGSLLDPPVHIPHVEDCLRRSIDAPFLNVTLEELREKGFVRAIRPSVAYKGMVFDHPDGKYRFPQALHEEPEAPEGFPYRLLTLIRGDAMHSQILEENQVIPPVVWVAPDHPGLPHLDLDEDVRLVSPLGSMRVKVEVMEGLHPEVILYRRGDWMKLGGGANRLIESGLTDIGRGAPFYHQRVRLENNRKVDDSMDGHF